MKSAKFSIITCVFLACCAWVSCRQGGQAAESPGKPQAHAELDESYVAGLYAHYSSKPELQAHKDENRIIDYILGQSLEYQRKPSGLYYYIVKNGEGAHYTYGQPCQAHYEGYFLDGRRFDSSIEKGEPLNFRLGQMIAGWNEILQDFNPGTELKIIVPSALAYGERGFPGYVPPNEVIAFDIYTIPVSPAAQ